MINRSELAVFENKSVRVMGRPDLESEIIERFDEDANILIKNATVYRYYRDTNGEIKEHSIELDHLWIKKYVRNSKIKRVEIYTKGNGSKAYGITNVIPSYIREEYYKDHEEQKALIEERERLYKIEKEKEKEIYNRTKQLIKGLNNRVIENKYPFYSFTLDFDDKDIAFLEKCNFDLTEIIYQYKKEDFRIDSPIHEIKEEYELGIKRHLEIKRKQEENEEAERARLEAYRARIEEERRKKQAKSKLITTIMFYTTVGPVFLIALASIPIEIALIGLAIFGFVKGKEPIENLLNKIVENAELSNRR